MVSWLVLRAFTAEGTVGELRSHMPRSAAKKEKNFLLTDYIHGL